MNDLLFHILNVWLLIKSYTHILFSILQWKRRQKCLLSISRIGGTSARQKKRYYSRLSTHEKPNPILKKLQFMAGQIRQRESVTLHAFTKFFRKIGLILHVSGSPFRVQLRSL